MVSLHHIITRLLDLYLRTVWQIAQRDYKFGKGKHRSLTKATYDAVGDHFRSLWGKEAGWAHSVLFTADLKAFSARLTTKVEVTEVKTKDNEETMTETYVKSENLTERLIKREFQEDETTQTGIEEIPTVRKAKRKRAR